MSCGIDVGRLQHQVVLRRRAAPQDALGQGANTWVDVATVWAAIEPLRGREFFAAGQLQAAVETRITLRWRDGVRAEDCCIWWPARAKLYAITAVIEPNAAGRVLELMCVEGIRDGR